MSSSALEKGSVYFDGTGDYLNVSHSSMALGTGDFTVEMWVRPTTSTQQIWFGSPGGTFRNGIAFGMRNGYMWWLSGDGNQWTFERNVGTALSLNTWSHVAITRNNYLSRFYVNGTLIDSLYDYNNLGQGSGYNIGAYVEGYNLTGHLSNVRVIRGYAAYTGSSFTLPIAPVSKYQVPGAVTWDIDTPILTCQSPTAIKDSGTYNHSVSTYGVVGAITVFGNAAPSLLSPFA